MTGPGILREDELVERDGILHRKDECGASEYRRRWESEASEDPVRSAIAESASGPLDVAALTAKTSPLWDRFPAGRHFEAVLEVGSGYGRIPLYLANARGATWSTYCAVDISEAMLRELRRHDERFGRNRDGTLHAICVSADELPLEDESVDLAISSAVFLHMGKSFVARTLAEIARVLEPGGGVVFDLPFPNARSPVNVPSRLKPRRLRAPNYMKYWTRKEVEALLESSGLGRKAGELVVAPAAYAVLPKRIGPVPVPLARRINTALGTPPERLRDRLATTYDVYSRHLISGQPGRQ